MIDGAARRWIAMCAWAASAGCSGRLIEVRTRDVPKAAVTLHVLNESPGAVNVFLVAPQAEVFLRRVGGKSADSMAVPGVSVGAVMAFKAQAVDGTRTWRRDSVTAQVTVRWEIREPE
jgi:hypothetical protein